MKQLGKCEGMRRLKFISSASRSYALPNIQRKCVRAAICYLLRQFCLSRNYRRNGACLRIYFLSFPESNQNKGLVFFETFLFSRGRELLRDLRGTEEEAVLSFEEMNYVLDEKFPRLLFGGGYMYVKLGPLKLEETPRELNVKFVP